MVLLAKPSQLASQGLFAFIIQPGRNFFDRTTSISPSQLHGIFIEIWSSMNRSHRHSPLPSLFYFPFP